MERLAIDELLKWKNKQYRKPLIIEGARQVGKTWLVKEFARQNYKQLAYVNFEEMKILQNLFEQEHLSASSMTQRPSVHGMVMDIH